MKCQDKVISFSCTFLYSGFWQNIFLFQPKLATATRNNKLVVNQTMLSTQTTPAHGEVALVLPTGAERFSANIRDMTGYSPLPFFKLCWKYLTPVVCTVSDPSPLTCFHTVWRLLRCEVVST